MSKIDEKIKNLLIICLFVAGLHACTIDGENKAENLRNKKPDFKIEKEGTYTDIRDGEIYKTVTINGKKVWFAENFAFKPLEGDFWAYDNDELNAVTYGYLYDWNTAVKIAPPGWRLPTKDEADVYIQCGLKHTSEGNGQFSGKIFQNYKGEWTFVGLNKKVCCWTSSKPHKPYPFPKTFVNDMNFDRTVNSGCVSHEYEESGLSVRYVKE